MRFLLLYLQISAIQGLNVTLRGSNSPCRGRLEVRDEKGEWGLVCHFEWTRENGDVVCKSLKCGHVVESGKEMTQYRDPPPPKKYLMDRVKCTSKENSLWGCKFSSADNQNCEENGSYVSVECSGNVEPSLNLNELRGKCAGVVEFSTQSGTFGVCHSDWDKNNADKICQELNCGRHHHIPKPALFAGQNSKQNVLLKCHGKEQYSWQCMEQSDCREQASVICTKHVRFRLEDGSNVCSGLVRMQNVTDNSWVPLQPRDVSHSVSAKDICTQLNCGTTGSFDSGTDSLRLTCAKNVTVLNFTSKCFGEVSVSVDGLKYGVCYNEKYKTLGPVVCRELGCGEVLSVEQNLIKTNGFLSDVECLGNEMSLWHCLANHGLKECWTTTVICSGSLDVRLSDGLSRCSGHLELQWKGSWKSISSKGWTNENSDVVCEHLKCGKSTKIKKNLFKEMTQNKLESSWNFKCDSSSAKLHNCLKFEKMLYPSDQKESNVQIICQEEKLKFFEGDSPCRGRVRINPFDDNGSAELVQIPENKTEVNKICREMQCGDVSSFEHNSTYGNVTCSGSVSVKLRNVLNERCWGRVEVCIRENSKEECGGVCRKTWEVEESRKICNNLGCGDPIKGQLPRESKPSVNDKSVYCLKEVQNINMCKFIPNSCSGNTAEVICSGSIKAELEDPRDKCAGNVLLFYLGKWTPVCKDTLSLDTNLQDAICRELNCGQPYSTSLTLQGDLKTGISGIKCDSGAESVSKCNLEDISAKTCTAGYLKCTGWKRLFLYKKEGPCSGPVYAQSEGKTQHVSGQGWHKEEGQKLCEYLQCGKYKSHNTKHRDTGEWWSKTYNCSGKNNMWECERQDQVVQPEQLNITCDDDPNVTLSDKCTGKVSMQNKCVCASHLDDQLSNMLCFSLGCGKAIHHWTKPDPFETQCLYPSCTGMETMLWQCGTVVGRCNKILYVACEKSIVFGSTKKCGGKLLVKYKDKWEYVCGKLDATDQICKELNCKKTIDESEIDNEIMLTINCPEKYQNISECVHHFKEKKKGNCEPVEIKCEGYIEEVPSSVNSGLIVGLSLGILGLLIMVFIWLNRKRLLLTLRHYRNNNGKDINTERNEMNNMDKEDRDLSQGNVPSSQYGDVDSVKNKTGEEDSDDRGEDSSGTEYDDIEGQNSDISPHQTHTDEDLPLLPKRPGNILADQDTYEVETENQEDYDDVMPVENAGRAGTQAQVDVDVDAGSDSEAGTDGNADAVVVTTEVEVHAKQE